MIVFFLGISTALFIFSIVYYKKIFNAVGFYISMFIIAVLCAQINNRINLNVMNGGLFWITIGLMIFIFSFWSVQIFRKNAKVRKLRLVYNMEMVNFLLNLCIVCAILNVIFLTMETLTIVNNISDIFYNSTWIRIQYLNRTTNPLLSVLENISNMTCLIFVCLFPIATKNKLKFTQVRLVIAFAMKTIASLVTMSKDPLVFFVVLVVAVYIDYFPNYMKEIAFLRKNVKWIFILLAGLFALIALQRSYIGTRYDNYFDAIIGIFMSYFSIPIESFSHLISFKLQEYTQGELSFRPIVNILSIFDVLQRVDIKQGFVGNSTGNVYTMFGTMYRDFGFVGIVFISAIYGLLCGIIYRRKHEGDLSHLFINAMVVSVLAFGFYDFKFIQTLYVSCIIYVVILENFLKKKLYVKPKEQKI